MLTDDFTNRANALLPHTGVVAGALVMIFLISTCGHMGNYKTNASMTTEQVQGCVMACGNADYVMRDGLCGCLTWARPGPTKQ